MSKHVTGLKAEILRRLIVFNIAILAISYFKRPFFALKVLRKVRLKRRSVQGMPKINKLIKSGNRYFFSDQVPGWPSEAFKGFFRAEIMRASDCARADIPLSTVFLSITARCPMRCRHCYEHENLSDREFMSASEIGDLILKFKRLGVTHIHFCGGEPLERMNDLLRFIEGFGKDIDLWIDTSGFGLTQEKAEMLRAAGLTGVEISLDHWDEAEHNRFRNNDRAFFWAGEAARNCSRAGLLTGLSLCATSNFVNGENLEKYTDLAMKWSVGFIRILEPRETTRFSGEDAMLSPEQISLLEDLFTGSASGKLAHSYPVISYPDYNQRRIGCVGAGNRYIYVDPRGDIHACPFCRHPAGNAINDDLFKTISLLRNSGCMKYNSNRTD